MTVWQEFPLRPQGQPWPGLNTTGGRLDPGMGQLEDGSFNSIINEADILEKRKGFIRGLDERFTGPVCGLFRYTDNCGIEYLVVADQDGIKVRTPFDIPTFLGSDSLPNDDFNSTLDRTRWNNSDDYVTFLSSLINESGPDTDATIVGESYLMQWFKPSAISSYQVEIQYDLVASGGGQAVAVAIKKTGSSYLLANVYLGGGEYVLTVKIFQGGVGTTLENVPITGAAVASGFLRLGYNAVTRTVTCRVIPDGGSQVTVNSILTEAQDNNLGQNSAIGLITASSDQAEIEQVTGGSLGT